MVIGVYRIGFVTCSWHDRFFADFPPNSPGTAIIYNAPFSLLLHWYPFYPSCHLVSVLFPRPSFSSYRICIILYEMFEIVHNICCIAVHICIRYLKIISESIHARSWKTKLKQCVNIARRPPDRVAGLVLGSIEYLPCNYQRENR